MSDYENNTKPSLESEKPIPVSNSMAAFSNKLNDLSESLDLLYIINNASGRHKFREKWPDVAEYMFDEQLTAYDVDGFNTEQREHRAKLEEEADMRRIELKTTISELVEKSVESGSLQFDYVGSVIDKYGAVIAQYLYEKNIIERVRPGSLDVIETKEDGSKDTRQLDNDMPQSSVSQQAQAQASSPAEASAEEVQEEAKLSELEKEILSNQVQISDAVHKDAASAGSIEDKAQQPPNVIPKQDTPSELNETQISGHSLEEDILLSQSVDPMDHVRPIEVSDSLGPDSSVSDFSGQEGEAVDGSIPELEKET